MAQKWNNDYDEKEEYKSSTNDSRRLVRFAEPYNAKHMHELGGVVWRRKGDRKLQPMPHDVVLQRMLLCKKTKYCSNARAKRKRKKKEMNHHLVYRSYYKLYDRLPVQALAIWIFVCFFSSLIVFTAVCVYK
mmetsp:Transcript_44641/g.71448  ORF Transcript_44641/g.71448 Transcript_44641/m.71448 type:complete len:132 (-) Transcript_44641:69-464(-)